MTSLSEHPVDSFRVNLGADVLTYPRVKIEVLGGFEHDGSLG